MMKAYPKYKDSGVPWLEHVPAHWDAIKTKHLFSERVQKGYPNEPLLAATQTKGVIPKSMYENRTVEAQKDLHLLKLVEPGDFVISLRSFQGGIEYAYYRGIISPAYTVMVPKKRILPEYYRHLAKSKKFISLLQTCVTGIREGQNINYEILRKTALPVPKQDEQQQISRYLYWQTAKINKFIKAKKKLIALLKEQKQNVINEAVTKGMTPDVEMKDSGVEWLGEIPKHWDVRRCKYILREINVRSVDGSEEHLSMSQKHGGLVGREEITERRLMSENYAGGKICNKGDIVLNRLKAHLGVFAVAHRTGVISPDYTVLNVTGTALPEFIECVLKSSKLRPELRVRCKGIVEGFWRLYTDDLYTLSLPLPPKEEQNEIIMEIARRSSKVDQTISKAEREIGSWSSLSAMIFRPEC